jgi:hypothetical protein
VFLSESGPRLDFKRTESADKYTTGAFKHFGYQTVPCNPVSATLSDLIKPSDTWLRSLDFGQTRWLFVLAVEEVNPTARFTLETGFAVVSGFLFEKRAADIRLVWRERDVGTPQIFGNVYGRKATVEAIDTAMAVNNGITLILSKIEQRSKAHPILVFGVVEENFSATCDAVWAALKDTLESDPKKFKIGFLDSSDKMAIYTTWHMSGAHEDHVVLKTQGGECAMQITQPRYEGKMTDEWGELIKRMRASLPSH